MWPDDIFTNLAAVIAAAILSFCSLLFGPSAAYGEAIELGDATAGSILPDQFALPLTLIVGAAVLATLIVLLARKLTRKSRKSHWRYPY